MRSLFALAVIAVSGLPARADFVSELAAAQVSALAQARQSRPARTAGCVVTSETPLAAVNQDKSVPAGVKMPVDIRQPAYNRIEIRVAGQPVGAGPFPGSPYAAKIAGIMVSELGAPGQWLVGVLITESGGGRRTIHAWQVTSKSSEPSHDLDIDLSAEGSKAMKLVAPSKNGDVTLDIACYASMPAASQRP
jgi:hypothetical protein